MTDAHVAVVPISALDENTSDALELAATLAPRVLGIHLRSVAADTFEREWAACGRASPLVVVDTSGAEPAHAFRRVLDVLERSQQLNQITVVLPARHELDLRDWVSPAKGRVLVNSGPRSS